MIQAWHTLALFISFSHPLLLRGLLWHAASAPRLPQRLWGEGPMFAEVSPDGAGRALSTQRTSAPPCSRFSLCSVSVSRLVLSSVTGAASPGQPANCSLVWWAEHHLSWACRVGWLSFWPLMWQPGAWTSWAWKRCSTTMLHPACPATCTALGAQPGQGATAGQSPSSRMATGLWSRRSALVPAQCAFRCEGGGSPRRHNTICICSAADAG